MQQSTNVISLRGETESGVENARIISVSGREAEIRLAGRTLAARVAFSCLIQPMPGDLVLCATDETGAYYVLGIIDRPGAQDMTISFPADATMVAEEGALSMVSGKSVTLASGDRLSCFSERAVHKSREAAVHFDELTARGNNIKANYQTIFLVSRMINTMARQVIEKFKSYVRGTEDYDHVNAGQMTRKVNGLYSMDSEQTVMVSRKHTKIDGERIFMG